MKIHGANQLGISCYAALLRPEDEWDTGTKQDADAIVVPGIVGGDSHRSLWRDEESPLVANEDLTSRICSRNLSEFLLQDGSTAQGVVKSCFH
jgi:hypothetical protein